MPNRHLLIGLIAIVIIATAGGVSYAALGGKPETTQVQQAPVQTNVQSATDTAAAPTTPPRPSTPSTTITASPTTSSTQTTSSAPVATGTSGGASTSPNPSPAPSPSPAPAPTPTPTPTPTPPAPTYTYKNGSFSKTVSYSTPGGSESLGVTIAITNDIISTSSVTISSTSGESGFYQTQFKNNYQSYVVGKALVTLNLSRVSGASLTTNAFNSALGTIRTLAKN